MSSDGSDEMRRLAHDLAAVPVTVLPKARQAMRKALADIQAGAQNRVPVDTGFLRSSISTSTQGNGHFGSGEVGPTANYGGYVENGTSRQRPQPYLRPATDAVLPGYHAALEQITGDIL